MSFVAILNLCWCYFIETEKKHNQIQESRKNVQVTVTTSCWARAFGASTGNKPAAISCVASPAIVIRFHQLTNLQNLLKLSDELPFTKIDVQQKNSSSDGGFLLFKTATNLSRGVATTLMADRVSVAKIWTQKVKLVRKSWPREIEAEDVGPVCNERQEMSGIRIVSTKNWKNISIPMSSETSRLPNNKKYPTLSNHPLYSGHLFSFLGPRSFAPTHRPDSPKWFHEKHNKKREFLSREIASDWAKKLGLLSCRGPSCHRNHYSRSLFCHHVCHHPRRRTCLSPGQHGGFLKTGALEMGAPRYSHVLASPRFSQKIGSPYKSYI